MHVIARGVVCAATGLVAIVTMSATGAAAPSAPRAASSPNCGGYDYFPVEPDFNGDGHTDYVVSMPGADTGAGAIELVLRGGHPVVYRPGTHGIPPVAAGAHFGATAQAFSVNGDKCDDLLVGIPGLEVNGVSQAGGVEVLFGTPTGFTAGPIITAGGSGAPGQAEADAHFGTSVFSEPYHVNDDPGQTTGTRVTVGVPGATVLGGATGTTPLRQAGELAEFDLADDGTLEPATYDYGIRTMASGAQAGAHYGTVASFDIVTAPDASDGNELHTGYLEVDRHGFFGRSPGEHLGVTVAEGPAKAFSDHSVGLYVGAPGRVVAGHDRAGAVERYDWNADSNGPIYDETITQATLGVPGTPTTGARFGAAVTAEEPSAGYDDVFIGAPGKRLGSARRAGAVYVQRNVEGGKLAGFISKGWTTITQSTKGVPGKPRNNAEFGAALAGFGSSRADNATRFVAVGVPGDHAAAKPPSGAVEVIPLGKTLPLPEHATLVRREGGPQPGDRFGARLTARFDV